MLKKFYGAVLFITVLCAPNAIGSEGYASKFIGRWALHLPGGAGYLEVTDRDGQLNAEILWYGGSVVPVEHVYVNGEDLVVTRIRQRRGGGEEKAPATPIYNIDQVKFSIYNDKIVGEYIRPSRDRVKTSSVKFTGNKIPDLPSAPVLGQVKYGKSIKLIGKNSMEGWELMGADKANGWSVKNGVLINNPVQKEGGERLRYGNLRSVKEFEDFKLKFQVNVPKGSNSGVYLRGIYEVQILDSYGKSPDSHNMGAIYSRITPSVAAEKPAGEWQDMEVILCDRHATVVLNGKTIIDNQPLKGVTGGAITSCEFKPGPIYLQGDHGAISYRNMVLTPIIK